MIGHLYVFRVSFQIFRGDHHHESHRPLVLEHLVGPSSHRSHTFHGRYSVIGDQYLKRKKKLRQIVPLLSKQTRITREVATE